jgi:glutathione S-transferase
MNITIIMSQFAIIISLLTLAFFQFLSIRVSAARGKYKIKAPQTTGHDSFDRAYRSHLNFMENMVIFLPLVAINSFSSKFAMIYQGFSVLWLAARAMFSFGYTAKWNYKTQLTFSLLAVISTVVLFLLAVVNLFIK